VVVNVVGSFVLGALVVLTGERSGWQLLLGTGLCGALTTWSTFAHETVRRAGSGEPLRAAAEAVAGIVAGLLAAALGVVVAGRIT
jgi:CrcB protein